jgi:hypothetical protein
LGDASNVSPSLQETSGRPFYLHSTTTVPRIGECASSWFVLPTPLTLAELKDYVDSNDVASENGSISISIEKSDKSRKVKHRWRLRNAETC